MPRANLRQLAYVALFVLPIFLVVLLTSHPASAAHPGAMSTQDMFTSLWGNFRTNLFKPLLLFFFVGLAIPLLKIHLEFPYAIYQGLTIYLLLSIGWRGGEELALLQSSELCQAGAFMAVGFVANTLIGFLAYGVLRLLIPNMRRVDSATVSAYYGSDSAGTFLACLGTLQAAKIAFAPYMPVMLAVMEIPGCLVGLFLVNRLRKEGMNSAGYMADEVADNALKAGAIDGRDPVKEEGLPALENAIPADKGEQSRGSVLREVFLNPGLFLLMSGITVGFISRLQGQAVCQADDQLFVGLFQGILCLFLMEMGMTAAKRMHDLKQASWRFIAFALVAPNVFAAIGFLFCHTFSLVSGIHIEAGTYALFAVLCAAASYIAVPAVQRLAIPEASPTLPLAASLGVTFVYNVTIGIPLYLFVAQQLV